VGAFAGIGWPGAFRRSLEAAGCTVAWLETFPDHHRYGGEEVEGLLARARREGLEGVVTTGKDAARLGAQGQRDFAGLWVAELTIRWNEPDAREALRDMLRASRLNWTRLATGGPGG
jgi:tetraacyldisaccharide-1-P 4'-kinase